MKLCSICNKNPAVVFVSKSDGKKMVNEGYCLPCAINSGITPIGQLAEQFAIDPEELKQMVDSMTDMLESGDMHDAFADNWDQTRSGYRLCDRVFLESGEKFDWPELSSPVLHETGFCYGLRDQIGVLADGTVVPCCLDHDGDIPLGNLFEMTLDEILSSPRAKAIYDGFSKKEAAEPLCRRCGYARRFK